MRRRAVRNVVRAAVVLAAVLAPTVATAQSAGEEFAIEQLESSRAALLEAVEGLSDAQWRFRESEDRWSAAEIVEHLALTEDFLFGLITEQVMRTERRAEPLPDAAEADRQVLAMVSDRSQRFEAPDPLQPAGSFDTPQEALEHFLARRERTLEFVRTTPDLRLYAMGFGGGPDRDAVQWATFIAGHTIRHTLQLRQVKDHSDFPGR
jgi:hypothetical protein